MRRPTAAAGLPNGTPRLTFGPSRVSHWCVYEYGAGYVRINVRGDSAVLRATSDAVTLDLENPFHQNEHILSRVDTKMAPFKAIVNLP